MVPGTNNRKLAEEFQSVTSASICLDSKIVSCVWFVYVTEVNLNLVETGFAVQQRHHVVMYSVQSQL